MNKLFPSALWLLTIATFVLLCAPAPCDNCLTCAGSFCLACTGTPKYFEDTASQAPGWRGRCFVFDERVALNPALEA